MAARARGPISPVDLHMPNSKAGAGASQGAPRPAPAVPGHLTPASPSEQGTLHKRRQQVSSFPGILFTPAAGQHPLPPGRPQPPGPAEHRGWLPTGKGSLPSSTPRPRRGGCEASPEHGSNLTKVTEGAGGGRAASPPSRWPVPGISAVRGRGSPLHICHPTHRRGVPDPADLPQAQRRRGTGRLSVPSRPAPLRLNGPGPCPAAAASRLPRTAPSPGGQAAPGGPTRIPPPGPRCRRCRCQPRAALRRRRRRRPVIYAGAEANQRLPRPPRAFPLVVARPGRGGGDRLGAARGSRPVGERRGPREGGPEPRRLLPARRPGPKAASPRGRARCVPPGRR